MVVKELPCVVKYIKTRNLTLQYKKVKSFLNIQYYKSIDFKLRQPKKYEVYQFKLNKKYRGFWVFRKLKNNETIFIVTKISDHQDF